jgi:release factor glutamine methyltransferase
VSGLDPLFGRVDVLVFNPPYVPTPSEEVASEGIEAAWAGGVDGREVIDRLLPLIGKLLSNRGLFYMVLVDENKPDEIASILSGQGLVASKVVKTKAKNEHLSIWK